MSLKTVLSLLAAFQAVRADFSHPLHFKKVDAVAAKSIAAAKGRVAVASGNLAADQGFWFSNFTIGGSPNLEILIDTGSSDAILNPGIYEPGPNSVNTNTPFSISYATTNPDGSGTLSASGNVYQDVITQHDANLTVSQQYLGVVTNPKSPPTFPHDGLIGYAGIDSSALNETPFFQSLCDQGSLSSCRFGLALNADETGTLYYGTVATDQFSGDLVSVSISDEWIVTGDITVNGRAVRTGASIITDSGTTVIFGPTSQVKTLFQQAGIQAVQTSNGITGYYACNAPPTIGLAFSGHNFNILPAALAFSQNGNNCTASIHGTSAFGNQWLVGQAFFQGKYIDHNVDDGTMGFATLL
ncbi:secreted aspartyl protease 1 [Trichoderma asperellum]|uniref:Secreted aspartyl protease 1 n=1 Tax=Trichoderma asperellum TaxID=101201 RepID=A0A6V8R3R8_TRIAP|nr:secreted aspartyl protease 1 [Trichoderma asperellum]